MTNKLLVVINSLQVPKIKKILLYEMKFLVPNYSCLQNPWLGGYLPPDNRSICPLSCVLNLLKPPPNKIPGYATAGYTAKSSSLCSLLQSPIILCLLGPHIFLSTQSRTLSAYVSPSMWETKFLTHTKQQEKLRYYASWTFFLHDTNYWQCC